jgi:hypothetical protein
MTKRNPATTRAEASARRTTKRREAEAAIATAATESRQTPLQSPQSDANRRQAAESVAAYIDALRRIYPGSDAYILAHLIARDPAAAAYAVAALEQHIAKRLNPPTTNTETPAP